MVWKSMTRWIGIVVAVVMLSTITHEAYSQNPNGKDCNTTYNCTSPCTVDTLPSRPPRAYCNKIVATGDAGNKCGDGDCTDHCEDDDTVLCGTGKGKTCADPNVADCSDPFDIYEIFADDGCV